MPPSQARRLDCRFQRRSFPRITFIGLTEPTPIPDDWIPSPDDEIDATRLCRRLAGLKRALDDLDGQARRLARWRARRTFLSSSSSSLSRGSPRFSPMRPGWPPGFRKPAFHAVDDVLRECHSLARRALDYDRGPPATVRSDRRSRPIDNDLSIGATNARSHGGGPQTGA
jgi:hypothetical protein